MTLFPCPACGFLVFSDVPGTYEICDVCGWEDDHVQLRYPTRGGANRESLVAAQRRVLAEYPLETKNAKGRERDPAWRPLTLDEANTDGPTTGIEHVEAAGEDAPPYYWKKV